jgi:hypothetical protein
MWRKTTLGIVGSTLTSMAVFHLPVADIGCWLTVPKTPIGPMPIAEFVDKKNSGPVRRLL